LRRLSVIALAAFAVTASARFGTFAGLGGRSGSEQAFFMDIMCGCHPARDASGEIARRTPVQVLITALSPPEAALFVAHFLVDFTVTQRRRSPFSRDIVTGLSEIRTKRAE